MHTPSDKAYIKPTVYDAHSFSSMIINLGKRHTFASSIYDMKILKLHPSYNQG